MSLPRVFISATSGDLRSARAIARDALLTINCHPEVQSDFEPDYRTVTDMLRGKISQCQALIHIVGHRYGAEPDPASLPPGTPRRSYTQMEYHLARELGLRVYTFLLPESYPYDTPPSIEDAELTALQNEHRRTLESSAQLYEAPADELALRTRIIALQEKVISLETEQVHIHKEVKTTRHLGLWVAAAIVLLLGGIGLMQMQEKGDADDLATKMAQVQEALSRIQQNTDPEKDPISQWPQERLETELARQMELKAEDLRALLTKGKTSLDALIAGQALLASGKAKEAGEKFDSVIEQEQAALQRLKQAYEGKAQIAWDAVRYDEALDYRQKAAALVDKATDPLGWCDAQKMVTFIQHELALYKEAESAMREIIRLREQHQGPQHPNLAIALNNLASLLQRTNRLEAAEPLYRRALKINETSYHSDHPEVAISLNNLAAFLGATNRLNEAEPMYRRALKINETRYGPGHPTVAINLNNLAGLLKDTNRLAEAEPMYRRALKIHEASYGPDHPSVGRDLHNLALLLVETNRLAEAEPMFQRVVAIFEKAYGPQHPNVATAIKNLARLLQSAKHYEEAEAMFRRVLKIYETGSAPDQRQVAASLTDLSLLLQDTKRLEEAEPIFRRVLKIYETSYSPDHPYIATALNNLARLLSATKRHEEAEPMFRRALEIDAASYDPDHPVTAIHLNNLAKLLQDTDRLAEAEPMYRRAVGILVKFQRSTGHEHPNALLFEANYRRLLTKMGKSEPEILEKLKALGVEE